MLVIRGVASSCRLAGAPAKRAVTASVPLLLQRGNASLQTGTNAHGTEGPPQPPASTAIESVGTAATTVPGRGRRKRQPLVRPQISQTEPRTWNRPVKEGVLPAYDLALQLIKADSLRLKEEAKGVRQKVLAMEGDLEVVRGKQGVVGEPTEGVVNDVVAKEAELEKLRAKLEILEVQSEINLPQVRWSVANAMGSFSFVHL